eukprot:3398964-Amphidinium_carterae.1
MGAASAAVSSGGEEGDVSVGDGCAPSCSGGVLRKAGTTCPSTRKSSAGTYSRSVWSGSPSNCG